MKKLLSYLLLAALLFSSLGPLAQVAMADGHKTTVVITKVESSKDAAVMSFEHLQNGISSDDWDSIFGAGAEGLKGISFTWFKVSEADFTTLMAAKPATKADVVEKISADGILAEGVVGPTNGNGVVEVELEDGYYWVIENGHPLVETSAAVPFGIELPFTGEVGLLDKIYVYPKNTIKDGDTDIEKDIDKVNNDIGEVHTWTVKVKVPSGVEAYEELGFLDELDPALDWGDPLYLTVSGVAADETKTALAAADYEFTLDKTANVASYAGGGRAIGDEINGRLTFNFTKSGLEAIKDYEYVEVSFDSVINEEAVMGQVIPNVPGLTYDNGYGDFAKPGTDNPPDIPVDPPSVVTGGKRFIKVDQADEAGLAGAKFVVKNNIEGDENKGKYVVQDAITLVISYTDDESAATEFVSGSKGSFEVKGLAYGDYILVETQAPAGYAKPSDPNTAFVVNKTSYYKDPGAVGLVDADPQKISNRKMTIPQTGGMGTVIFTLLGGLLMIGSVVFYRRTKLN